MCGNTLLWVISILQVFILGVLVYVTIKMKSMKLMFSESTLYKEMHYIRVLLVFATIVLVFFGWNIQENIVKKLTADIEQDLKKVTNRLENKYGVLLLQNLQASKEGNIVEIPLEKLENEIQFEFKKLVNDINGKPINNGKDFENTPIVNLNYIGQPYTITKVTNKGFTVKKLAIYEGYTIGEMKPPSYIENKLIIWIINRD